MNAKLLTFVGFSGNFCTFCNIFDTNVHMNAHRVIEKETVSLLVNLRTQAVETQTPCGATLVHARSTGRPLEHENPLVQ